MSVAEQVASVQAAIDEEHARCPRCDGPITARETAFPTSLFRIGAPQTPEMSRPAVVVECDDAEDCAWAAEAVSQ